MDISELLSMCISEDASDLHLTFGEPPMLRIDGVLVRTSYTPLTQHDLQRLIRSMTTEQQWESFLEHLEYDFSYAPDGMMHRFRVNIHQQRGVIEAACRRVPMRIPEIEELGLPPVVREFIAKRNGLVLVTGATGMGKTTTLASLVEAINHERECMIVTIEDPIEYVHTNRRGIVKQREVNTDTRSFPVALRSALRQDPDVIVIGEIRDLETIATALTAAETGHLVLATLHTTNAVQTIERLIDVFPPHQQQQIRLQVANTLQAVIAQLLIPRAFSRGQVLAAEVAVVTPAIRNMIREHQFEQIYSAIETGAQYGMCTMDRTLRELCRCQKITEKAALARVRDPDYFRLCA